MLHTYTHEIKVISCRQLEQCNLEESHLPLLTCPSFNPHIKEPLYLIHTVCFMMGIKQVP
jgi:hypothetical protein